jgi:hypothetical protein
VDIELRSYSEPVLPTVTRNDTGEVIDPSRFTYEILPWGGEVVDKMSFDHTVLTEYDYLVVRFYLDGEFFGEYDAY